MTATAFMPLPDSLVARAVLDEYRARREAEGPRPTAAGTRGRGSQAHQCARRIAFEVVGAPRDIGDSDFNLITWKVGQQVHDEVQKGFIKHFKARIEVPISHQPKYDVSGHADVVYNTHPITGETRPNLVAGEIKSMSQYGFDLAIGAKNSRYDLPGPKPEHIEQVAMYGLAPQLDSAFIHLVYVGKDRGSMAEWLFGMDDPLPHLDGISARELGTNELERLTRIFEELDAGTLPARVIPGFGPVAIPAEPDSKDQPWNCRFCSWQPTCKGLVTEALPLETVMAEPVLTVGGLRQLPRREDLLERIGKLTQPARASLKASWGDLPSLRKPEGWNEALLAKVEGMVEVLERFNPPAPEVSGAGASARSGEGSQAGAVSASPQPRVHPDSLDDLRRTLEAMPSDLRENLERQAVDAGVPHFAQAGEWTIDHCSTVVKLLDVAYELHRDRIAAVCASCKEAGLDDDGRHALVSAATAGEHSSSKTITGPQADRARDLAHSITKGLTKVRRDGDRFFFEPVDDVDWPQATKDAGVSQRALIAEAARLAGERGEAPPKRIDSIPKAFRAHLEAWLDTQKAAAA